MSTTDLAQFLPASGGIWAYPSPQGFDHPPSGEEPFKRRLGDFLRWAARKLPSVRLEECRSGVVPTSDYAKVAREWDQYGEKKKKKKKKKKKAGKHGIPQLAKSYVKPRVHEEHVLAASMETVVCEFLEQLVRWNVGYKFQWCPIDPLTILSQSDDDTPPCWPDSQFRDITGRDDVDGCPVDTVDDILVPIFRPHDPRSEPNHSHRAAREKFARWLFATGRRNFIFSMVIDSEGTTDGVLVHLFYDQSPTWPLAEGELSRSITLDLEAGPGVDSLWGFLWRLSLATKRELGVANANDGATDMSQVKGVPWAWVEPSCQDQI